MVAEPVRPTRSVTVTRSVCAPAAAVVVFQVKDHGAAVSVPALAPSTNSCAEATPLPVPSLALAVTVMVPATQAPAAGAVMLTVGEPLSVVTESVREVEL